jgi:hypothetical protein
MSCQTRTLTTSHPGARLSTATVLTPRRRLARRNLVDVGDVGLVGAAVRDVASGRLAVLI